MKSIFSLDEYRRFSREERLSAYLETEVYDQIPVHETGEALVGIPAEHPFFFEKDNTYAFRKEVLQMLEAAAKTLPVGVHLKMYSTFRPIEVQRELFKKYKQEIAEKHGLHGIALQRETTKFIADPDGCPPHSTGGAVDLTLCDEAGVEFDMGSGVDVFEPLGVSYIDANLTSKEAIANRELLLKTMLSVGFCNLPTEWWHYSYGDRYWAAFYDKPGTLYAPRSISDFPGVYSR